MKRLNILAAALSLAFLAGCSLAPHYQRPALPVPDELPLAPADGDPTGNAADLHWQQFVQDDELRELVGMALEGNRDLRIAVQNIELARAQYRIRRADQLPTLSASVAGERGSVNSAGANVQSGYSVGLGVAAWELDFFGRVASLKDAALAQFLATTEARKAAQISLVASVASAWLQLKTDTELLALAERTLETREQSLELMRMRFENGASSALDLRQTESLAASARASVAQQRRLRGQDLNLLALLVGAPIPEHLMPVAAQADDTTDTAGELVAMATPTPDLPQFHPVPAGLSSDLLLQRPDIRAAEQQLIAANADIGAARANFFPRITLTGTLGRISGEFEDLFGSDGQRVWSVGAGLSLPIFDMGRNRANLAVAKAAREIAVAQYEKAIQTGFREVADALIARSTLVDELAAFEAQADAERDRFQLAELRYRNGVASYLDLLDAQRSLYSIEQALAQTRLAQRASEVQLYQALGGGWSDSE